MDETYLTLRGWDAYAYRASTDGEIYYFMHNPFLCKIINRKGIIEGENRKLNSGLGLTSVKYSEVWPYLLEEVYKFENKQD